MCATSECILSFCVMISVISMIILRSLIISHHMTIDDHSDQKR